MQCSHCHAELKEGAKFCNQCGQTVAEPAAAVSPEPTQVHAENHVETASDTLPSPQSAQPPTAKAAVAIHAQCPRCQAPTKQGTQFCNQCGASTVVGKEPAPEKRRKSKKRRSSASGDAKSSLAPMLAIGALAVGALLLGSYYFFSNSFSQSSALKKTPVATAAATATAGNASSSTSSTSATADVASAANNANAGTSAEGADAGLLPLETVLLPLPPQPAAAPAFVPAPAPDPSAIVLPGPADTKPQPQPRPKPKPQPPAAPVLQAPAPSEPPPQPAPAPAPVATVKPCSQASFILRPVCLVEGPATFWKCAPNGKQWDNNIPGCRRNNNE